MIKKLLLAKTMLNTIEVLVSNVLIDSDISCDEFVSVNDELKELVIRRRNKKFYDY